MAEALVQRPGYGIGLKLLSVAVFTTMAALIKTTAHTVPAGEQVFFRSFFAIPVILAWLRWRGLRLGSLRSVRPMGHVWRGFAGTTAMGLSFAGTGMLPLPEVTALGFAAPLLTVIFAAMFLNEEVRAFRLMAVALGLAGVMIVLAPRMGGVADGLSSREQLGAMVTLTGAVFAALAQVFVRKLVLEEPASTVVFWFSVTAAGLALLTLPFGWAWPSPGTAALLVMTGLLGGLGQALLTSSYRWADASLVAPFDYAAMIFALLIGFFVFAEVPTRSTLIGAGIICVAGVLIIWRERQLGLERARQRRAMPPGSL